MVTQVEEQQAKDFLKRAEIRTMKKDLRALREGDALKERDKIVQIKTLEEQEADHKKKLEQAEKIRNDSEKAKVERVLMENEKQEHIAEKDLKNYATEQERQQIFLLESQRVSLEKQMDAIDEDKIPVLKLEKNKLLSQKGNFQVKLSAILADEKKLEGEQSLVAEKAKTTTVASQKKALEQRRWDIDKDIQEIEKKSWAVEKEMQNLDEKVKEMDDHSEQLILEKNQLKDKILGIDKSLREIYSGVIGRVEEKRQGQAEEQRANREALSKTKSEQNEKVQREQWGRTPVPKKKEFLAKAPADFKEKLAKSATSEEEQRAKFMQDVETWSKTKDQPTVTQKQDQETVIQIPVPRKKN
ncbi:MAG: hypothetical protein Q8Q48_01830 [Candidatus Staskawiczbacteria bacterium]|nr:hypothetical protein [Candidatus Staskawiczbacteria bacterium]